MVYDRDLKFTVWGIVVVGLLNIALAVICAFRGQWIATAACLIWCANLRVWWGANRNLQRQRDRNREIEAAMLKVLAGDRY